MDPLDLILGGNPDPAAKAKALEFLMRQRQAGMINQFSGDKVLMPIGVRQVGAANERADTLGRQGIAQQELLRRTTADEAAAKASAAKDAEDKRRWEAEMGLKRQGLLLDRTNAEKPPKPASPDELRREFQGQQGYKDFQQVAAAYEKIKGTSPTGPGDMSLIFGYMKLLDPNSTVREGEYATAANAGSVPETLIARYNKVLKGELLAPELRAEFRNEAQKVYRAQKARFDATAKPYAEYAKKQGLDPGDVIFGYQPGEDAAAPAPPEQTETPASPTRMKGNDGKWYVLTPAGWEAE
jgi:hypothetical protein